MTSSSEHALTAQIYTTRLFKINDSHLKLCLCFITHLNLSLNKKIKIKIHFTASISSWFLQNLKQSLSRRRKKELWYELKKGVCGNCYCDRNSRECQCSGTGYSGVQKDIPATLQSPSRTKNHLQSRVWSGLLCTEAPVCSHCGSRSLG